MGVGNRQWIFETFLSDYKQGAFKAMLEVFPDIGEEGCFFHLYKRLDFQVKELGLMAKYRQDDAFKLRVKKHNIQNRQERLLQTFSTREET